MQNKLQELTEKLYQEGLSKGKTEADQLLNEAKIEAKKIIDDAKTQAESIIANANKDAADSKKNAETEMLMASRQVVTNVKQSVENLIITKSLTPAIGDAMKNVEFVQSLIKTAIEKFDVNGDNNSLFVLLPETQKSEFDKFINDTSIKQLNDGKLEFKFSKNINSGFQIGAKDKGYYISFTEQDFDNLFREYVRPKMQQLLFSNN